MKQPLYLIIILATLLYGCAAGKASWSPAKKYSPQQLEKDFAIYQDILEKHHPGLYWYTPKDSMDHYFQKGRQLLKDSMNEAEFRKVLSYVTSKINCGHTSVRSSKAAGRYVDSSRSFSIFPLSMKLWDDTMVVSATLLRRDSVLKRGDIITAINGKSSKEIIDSLFQFISTDGYNKTHKLQVLSNRGFFGSMYSTVFGLQKNYRINFIDSAGQAASTVIPAYVPAADSSLRVNIRRQPGTPQPERTREEIKKQRLASFRLLQIDTANRTAMMSLSSFGRGYELKKFFRQSFRQLRKDKIGHLIVDVRTNGGGSVTNSTLITRFIARQSFKISDSLYAIRKGSKYNRYIQNSFWNNLFITFFTRKKQNGYRHFGYFERHHFKPKKKNHFDGKVYILTGGNSFSATTLFATALMQQDNVTVVGEETGGGAYGNSAWLIPDVTLPVTGVRFRLPLFRLVIDKTLPKNGRGVIPEVESKPTVEAIRKGSDFKIEKVLEMIKEDKGRM